MLRTHIRPLVVGIAFATAATTGYTQQLEEVVVTAQKREQTLSEVPISLSAISGELVQDAAIKSFQELGQYVPNLSITENAVNSIISMRGIGVGAQQSFEQSVGIFVDGVHLGKSRQTRLGMFDLQQVEVLRGPQGILFGKNTLAGAINVVTASPTVGEGTSGRFAVSKESNDGDILEGWLQTSLTDNFAVRFAMRDSTSDGHLTNSIATGSNGATPTGPTTDETIWRLSARWEVSDATSVDLKWTESDFTRLGSNATVTSFGTAGLDPSGVPGADGVMYYVMGQDYSIVPGMSDIYRDAKTIGGNILSGGTDFKGPNERDEGTKTQNEELSLNVQHDFDNGVRMNYVFGDSFYEYEDGIDADFLPVEFIGRADDSTYEQTSHELRFSGSVGDNFDWVGGANYVDSEQKIDRVVAFDGTLGSPATVATALGGAYSNVTGALGSALVDVLVAVDAAAVAGGAEAFLQGPFPDGALPAGLGNYLVPGTPTAFALNPWDTFETVAPLIGVEAPTLAQVLGGLAVGDLTNLGVWQAAATGYAQLTGGHIIGDNYGVDGSTMTNASARLSYWQQDTESTSAFFQGTYRINEAWSVTAGVRHTSETKDVYARTDLSGSATGLGTVLSPEEAPFVHAFNASTFASWAHEFDDGRKTTQTIPGMTVQWEPNDNSNYYLSYSEGFKSGGFNSVDDQNPQFALNDDGSLDLDSPIRDQPGPGFEYDDETASSWEIGGKHRLMDGRMQLNWAAYSSTYENLQVSSFAGLGFIVANAAEANVEGFEFDVNYQATENLRIAVAMAFNDGEYASFPGAGCSTRQQNALAAAAFAATGSATNTTQTVGFEAQGCTQVTAAQQSQNLKGEPVGTDYNGSVQLDYAQPLSNDMMWFTQVDYNFTDGYFLQGDREPVQFEDGYARVNVRTGLRTDQWFIQVYGRNIGDEQVASGGFNIPLAQGSFGQYITPGAVYGLQAAYQF